MGDTSLSIRDVVTMSTGYTYTNIWLKWIMSTAKEQHIGDCIACASARPQLFTEPAPLYPEDQWHYECMLGLTQQATPPNCITLASLFLVIPNNTAICSFIPSKREKEYTCVNFTSANVTMNMEQRDLEWCNDTILNGSLIGQWARSGLYYYCG